MSRVLTFGGAFNPVHIGHVRAAVEVVEALQFDRVDWIPTFAPPHKAGLGLLSFDLRVKLLHAAVRHRADFSVDEIEKSLPSPSFTFQTLDAMTKTEPARDRSFLLGDREFLRLPKWVRGREVVNLAHIVVVCRTEFNLDLFASEVAAAWPQARRVEAPAGAWAAFELLPGRSAVLLRTPRLDISSSLVRQRWLDGRSLEEFVPDAVIALLESQRSEVAAAWSGQVTTDPNALGLGAIENDL